MKASRHWLWLLAALPCLTLVMREVWSQEAASPPPAKAAQPAEPAAVDKPAAPAPEVEVAEAPAEAGDPEEKVSADNNLSFPVDI